MTDSETLKAWADAAYEKACLCMRPEDRAHHLRAAESLYQQAGLLVKARVAGQQAAQALYYRRTR